MRTTSMTAPSIEFTEATGSADTDRLARVLDALDRPTVDIDEPLREIVTALIGLSDDAFSKALQIISPAPTTKPAAVQAFAHTYDDDASAAYAAVREARPANGAMWDQDDADAFEARCTDVYERVMAAAGSDVRQRTDFIIGMFEPQTRLGASEKLALFQMATAIDDREADLIEGLMECVVDDAEKRGEDLFMKRMERALKARQDTE